MMMTMMMSNESSELVSFLADDDATVHAMMNAVFVDNRTSMTSDDEAAAEDGDDSCGAYNWPVLFLFTIVIAAIGENVLVCVAVKRESELRSMFNYFLVSLALSDMLSAILVMPLSILRSLIACLRIPKLVCFVWYSLDVFFTSSTICHLCMISIDRYFALKFPLRYGLVTSKRRTVIKISIVWVVSFCIAGPLFVLSTLDSRQSLHHYKGCGPETQTFIISATVASFYVPLLIMTVMYALTVHALRRQLREQRSMTVNQLGVYRGGRDGELRRPEQSDGGAVQISNTAAAAAVSSSDTGAETSRRAIRVLGILFVVFVAFYLPFFVAYTVHGTCASCDVSPRVIVAFEWLQYGGAVVNPVVYHVFNPEFRRAFIKILRCR